MEKARGRIKRVREKWIVFSHTYHKMACLVSGSDEMHHRQRFKI
jgi:hypothetical protein